jgi:hypothetical protein
MKDEIELGTERDGLGGRWEDCRTRIHIESTKSPYT